MSAVYCRHCGGRITDPIWHRYGFCSKACAIGYETPPEPIDVSPGAFMTFPADGDGAS